ncbi:hypothetical protein [Amycolatopsis circi]|nr:hypothetical protein [Amycolatopsis circi]
MIVEAEPSRTLGIAATASGGLFMVSASKVILADLNGFERD